MTTTTITARNFDQTVSTGTVVIDWWAPWCGPCRAFAPTFEKAAEKHPEITFGKVNTEEEPSLAQQFQIRSIPTLMVIRDGVMLFAQPGMLPAAALESLVQQVQALDMDEVRREIARGQPAAANA